MHSPFINREIDRILAVTLLLATLAAGYVFARYVYLERLIEVGHEIELKKKKNAKINSILANEKDIRVKINQQKGNILRNKIFLSGGKAATAITELQNSIKLLVSKNSRARIETIKPYPVLQYDNYSEASLEIRIKDISHQGLLEVLYKIESNSPVLLINELNIKLSQVRYTTLVEEKEKTKKLAVTMVVSGFFREPAGGV
jgi:hypothetical protein